MTKKTANPATARQNTLDCRAIDCHIEQSTATLSIAGRWSLDAALADFSVVRAQLEQATIDQVRVVANGLTHWDSTLVSYLLQLHRFCAATDITLSVDDQLAGVKRLLALATKVPPAPPLPTASKPRWPLGGKQWLRRAQRAAASFTEFIGLVGLACYRLCKRQAKTRLSDTLYFIDQAGPAAMGIIALTSVLVGMILAYLGSVQLQQFGAQIYVANLVALGMTREMGALMTAVVMAGRTGVAYAAPLGTMQANEEIDSIVTLGISPVEFLVLPRMISLVLIMPLLTLYSMLLGTLGGSFVAISMDISASQYIAQLQDSITMVDIATGLCKSVVFAVLIAVAGCQAGLQCGRTSAAVGQATTRAVVSAIVYLIVADAAMNIIYQVLGI